MKASIAELFDAAGLKDARSHDLRRTFGSIAADEGYSDATIGELLGHSRRGVTQRHYIRRPDAALIAAADRISAHIAAALGAAQATAQVIPMWASGMHADRINAAMVGASGGPEGGDAAVLSPRPSN